MAASFPPQRGVEDHLLGGGSNLSTVFGQRQEDVQDLPVDTTSNERWKRPQNEQKLKESPLQAMDYFKAFMQIHAGHVIYKILLISP